MAAEKLLVGDKLFYAGWKVVVTDFPERVVKNIDPDGEDEVVPRIELMRTEGRFAGHRFQRDLHVIQRRAERRA